ncbi:MAG: transglutaminase-like domain-containing protein [Victivallaceae bacterium]|nr:transglutaminase-like domain-containing protein [Victivallaceae bacterium]
MKSFKELMLVTVIILPSLFLFSVAADLPHVFVVTVGGLIGSMLIRKTFKLNDRSIIYTGVMIFVMIVLLDYMFKLDRNRFGLISSLLRPNLLVPMTFYAAVALTFFRSGKETIGVAAAAALVGIMLSGDVNEFDPLNTRLFMFTGLHANMEMFFFVIMVLELTIILLAVSYSGRIHQNIVRGKAIKRILLWGAVITVPLLTWSFATLYDTHGDVIRRFESQLMRIGMRKFRYNQRKVFHGGDIDLNRTSNADMIKNQQLIVLRAATAVAPGYLRGFVYTEYRNGRWYRDENTDPKMMQSKQNGGMLASKLFSPGKIVPQAVSYEIYPTSDFSSDILLTPGNSRQLELIADRVSFTVNGEFKPTEWEQDGGYSVQMSKIVFPSAYYTPEPPDPNSYIAVPDKLAAPLGMVLKRLELECDLTAESSDKERFTKMEQWFHSKFKYKLRDQGNGETDPVLWFLNKTREGHCELFASSMALLLRKSGIQTRYVTGFVCNDRHPSGRYYVARLGNAHAWVEAWERETRRWVLLEPTPATGVPNLKSEWNTASAWGDRFQQLFQSILLGLRRGYFAEMIIRVASELFKLLLDLLWNPVVTPLLIAFIGYRFHRWRRNRHNRRDPGRKLSPEIVLLSHEFTLFEHKIRKLYPLIPEQATLVEFIDELKGQGAPEPLIILLNRYQTVRFDPTRQDNDDVEPLIKAIRAAKRELKNNPIRVKK